RLVPVRERRPNRGRGTQPRPCVDDDSSLRSARRLDRARHARGETERSHLMQQDRALLQTHHSLEYLKEKSVTIGDEFFTGFEAVEKIDRPAVSCFGSARVPEGSKPYELAREVGKLFAKAGWAVVTGGGPGVMEAANRGCQEGGGLSVGFGI